MPYKVSIDEQAEDLDIGDDEFNGESLHIVYDTLSRYFMIQINRFSMSLNGIAAYINRLNNDPRRTAYFKVFHKNLDLSNLRFQRYKVLEIGLANVWCLSGEQPVGFLGKLINNICDLRLHIAKLVFSMGRNKGSFLTNSTVEQFFGEIPAHRDMITNAKIKYCEGDMEKGEKINLLDFLEESILELRIQARKTITFDYTINQCV